MQAHVHHHAHNPYVTSAQAKIHCLVGFVIGEVLSIGVMEMAMNWADYRVGGMQAGSVVDPVFWLGIGVAIPAGFLAAWPVNYWLIKRDMKKCHQA